MIRRLATLACIALAALAAGCSSDKPKPAPLVTFAPQITGHEVWNKRIDGVSFDLQPAVVGGIFYVGSDDGTVLAIDAENGNEVWRAKAGASLSAGVGSDGRYAAVGTRNNEVVTFDRGREIWRTRLPAGIVTAPLVAGERVFVMTVDRAVYAFDAAGGERLWALQRPGDALTLAEGGVIAAFHNSLLVGQGPRLAAIDPVRGALEWEATMATPRGTNEVERLADLVGPALRIGDRVCARAFQSAVACADAARGAMLWSRNVGGTKAIGGTSDRLFGADASDRITAWRAIDGEPAWTSEKLLNRGLSGALAVGTSVVFGDDDGYVHFLSQADGAMQLRIETDGSAVVGTPVVSGKTILVVTRKGGLHALRPN